MNVLEALQQNGLATLSKRKVVKRKVFSISSDAEIIFREDFTPTKTHFKHFFFIPLFDKIYFAGKTLHVYLVFPTNGDILFLVTFSRY